MKKIKYLVVGGGISGLTFANYVKDDYLVIEKENRVGGYCKTTKKDGFVWDYAGHFYHFKTEYFKKLFEDNIKEKDLVYKDKCTKIIYKEDLIEYPFQTNIHQLKKDDFIDCLYDLFNKEEKDDYDNFLDMLYGKFGKSITEIFLKPYNEKLYAIDLKKLDVDAMGRFFPYADKEAIINNMKRSGDSISYNNYFLYPKDGAYAFVEILYKQLDKEKVLLNTALESVDINNKIAVVNGEKVAYEYLINTTPLNMFMQQVNEKEHNQLVDKLSYNQVLVFNLGFNEKANLTEEHWIYLPEKDLNFYRIGFYDNILDGDKLSMYIEIGYPKGFEITEGEITKQLEYTLSNLKKLNVIKDSTELIAHETIIMDPAYVHINGDTDKEVKNAFQKLADKDIYSIGRYGAWTYCSMEDSMDSARSLALELMTK